MLLAEAWSGLCDGNEAAVEQALGLDKSKQTQEAAGLAAAVCGNGKLVLPMLEELSRKYPEDTLIQDVYLPLSKGYVALAAGQPQQAVAEAEPAKPYSATYPALVCRGWLISRCMMPATRSTCSSRRRSTGQPCCCRG